jgi:hypothetical protein
LQLSLLLGSVITLGYAICRLSGSALLGWRFLALVASAGNMLLSASDIATEAVLSSLLVLHMAQLYLLLNGGRTVIAHAAGAPAQGDYQRVNVS